MESVTGSWLVSPRRDRTSDTAILFRLNLLYHCATDETNEKPDAEHFCVFGTTLYKALFIR